MERERGVMLRMLDMDALTAAVSLQVGQAVKATYRYAAAELNGVLYVLCSEGVGWVVDADSPVLISLYRADGGEFGVSLGPGQVRERMSTGEIDLADFVRVFGARLESNFRIWYRRLSG